MSQPGDVFSENPVKIQIPLVCYRGVFIPLCFVLLSRFFMLTWNTFMTNVLYGEAVKVSLYAIPESTSCNCMPAIKKLKTYTLTENCGYHLYFSLRSPPPRLPWGIPTMTAIIEKQKARGGRWVEEKGESLSYSRPLPVERRALSFSFSPTSLRHKRELKQRRFWATDVNRKWGIFPLNMPWRHKICIP